MTIEDLATKANANLPLLDRLKPATKQLIQAAKPADLVPFFEAICLADSNAADLETRTGSAWGFTQYDARFLRSLRDQQQGTGEFDIPKPLTTAQLRTLRAVLLREPYLTQVTLLT